ncbi:MAG: DUF2721 domain-containing protein [Cytophagales bacterium]|nr:DUF2721 domain-containing protein [Cytophagales bacterium]
MLLDITTPALLFPAITLLLLAYTNRFLAIATLIRNLHKQHLNDRDHTIIIHQIKNLRIRLNMIRYMQAFGILSFFLVVLCMFMLFERLPEVASYLFAASLMALLISLGISLIETHISTQALNLELSDMEEK